MSTLISRLFRAFARAYMRAHGLDQVQPPVDPEQYAEFLYSQRRQLPTEAVDVPVRVQLRGREVLELVELHERVADLERRLENATREVTQFLEAHAEARAIMRSGRGDHDERVRKAARRLCLSGLSRRPMWLVAFEYEQLRQGYYDPATQTTYPPASRSEALESIAKRWKFPSVDAVAKALQRAKRN